MVARRPGPERQIAHARQIRGEALSRNLVRLSVHPYGPFAGDGRVVHDVLRTYGKVTLKAHEKTNCATEILFPEAEQWVSEECNLKGPLAGIPVSLKDTVQVKGFDISVGFSTHTGKPYAEDGPMVRLLKDAGAVPFVKTNLPTTLLSFESTNDVWGRCKNPHNPDYSPGGSTGGESALLAFGGSRIELGAMWQVACECQRTSADATPSGAAQDAGRKWA